MYHGNGSITVKDIISKLKKLDQNASITLWYNDEETGLNEYDLIPCIAENGEYFFVTANQLFYMQNEGLKPVK